MHWEWVPASQHLLWQSPVTHWPWAPQLVPSPSLTTQLPPLTQCVDWHAVQEPPELQTVQAEDLPASQQRLWQSPVTH